MSEDRDPILTELFAEGRDPIADGGFSERVMERVARSDRRRTLLRIGLDIAVVLIAWLIAEPVQELVYRMLPGLTRSLVELDNELLAQALLPLNSVTGILAVSFLVLRSVYRRLFRRGA